MAIVQEHICSSKQAFCRPVGAVGVLSLTAIISACGGYVGSNGSAATTTAVAVSSKNFGVPPNSNTTDRAAPFYIDLTGLDLSTVTPTRHARSPNYPPAIELPDGQLPPKRAEGNFILGPTHTAAAETIAQPGVPAGSVYSFTMNSADSAIYNPGWVRDETLKNEAVYSALSALGDPSSLILTTVRHGAWSRKVNVYVPKQYVPGKPIPFIVSGDGGGPMDKLIFATMDNLISQGRVPPMAVIAIQNGGFDSCGSERGREYDTVSGTYSDFVELEVLPLVTRATGITLTTDPKGRAAMGTSSSGTAAVSMAWFHPERYSRVLAYSPTLVNRQWPHDPMIPGGAWQFHSKWAGESSLSEPTQQAYAPLIPSSPTKDIRFWFEAGDKDNFYTTRAMNDGMQDWTLASENMAQVLAAKGYHYQFVFAKNAEHVDAATVSQTLPYALEWLWADYVGH